MRLLGLWIPSLAWMGLIFWLSSIPDLKALPLVVTLLGWLGLDALPAATGMSWDLEWILRKSAHFTVFFVLTLLYARSLGGTWPRLASRRVPLAALLALGYAFFDEWHQTWVPTRSGRMGDVLIDGTGVFLGALVLWIRSRILGPKED